MKRCWIFEAPEFSNRWHWWGTLDFVSNKINPMGMIMVQEFSKSLRVLQNTGIFQITRSIQEINTTSLYLYGDKFSYNFALAYLKCLCISICWHIYPQERHPNQCQITFVFLYTFEPSTVNSIRYFCSQ